MGAGGCWQEVRRAQLKRRGTLKTPQHIVTKQSMPADRLHSLHSIVKQRNRTAHAGAGGDGG